jgi:hypothetical protein
MKWIWLSWLLLIALSFSALEGYALADHTTTLSRWVWDLTAAFPPLPFIAGFLSGFLCCHFWWGGIVPFKGVK